MHLSTKISESLTRRLLISLKRSASIPSLGEAFVGRSAARFGRGDLDGALADATHAAQLDPKDPQVYLGRAGILIEKRDYAGAIADCTKAIEIDAESAFAYGGRAKALLKSGRAAEFIARR